MNLGAVVEIQQQQQQHQGLYQSHNFPNAHQSSSSQYVHSQNIPTGLHLVNHNFNATAQQQMSMGNSPYASQSEAGNFSLQFIQNQANISQVN
jgi:hypothetical protein